MVWLYSVVLVSNMVGVKNKRNDIVECGGIVATSEQWLRLVIYMKEEELKRRNTLL